MLTRRGMAIFLSLSLWSYVAVSQEKKVRTRQTVRADQIQKISIQYPHLKVILLEAQTPKYEVELLSSQAVQFEIENRVLLLRRNGPQNLLLEKREKAPLLTIQIKGPSQEVEIQSWKLNIDSKHWKRSIKTSSQQADMFFESMQAFLEAQAQLLNLKIRGGGGRVSLFSKEGVVEIQQFAGDLRSLSGESSLTIKDSEGSYEIQSFAGPLTIIDSRGRVEAKIKKSSLELIKFAGVGEFQLDKTQVRIVPHPLGRLSFQDEKSRYQILKEVPAWIDLKTELGAFSVEPLKPIVQDHQTVVQGYTGESKGTSFVKIRTHSGRVILK